MAKDETKKHNENSKNIAQEILRELLDSMEYEGCDFATDAAIKHVFKKHGVILEETK